MSFEPEDLLARCRVPDAHGFVVGRGNDPLPVGAEYGGIYAIGMPLEFADHLAGFDAAQRHCITVESKGDLLPVRAEYGRNTYDRADLQNCGFSPDSTSQICTILLLPSPEQKQFASRRN